MSKKLAETAPSNHKLVFNFTGLLLSLSMLIGFFEIGVGMWLE